MVEQRKKRNPLVRAALKTVVGTREVFFTLAQVALFFSIFLWILQLSLPRGTGLVAVYDDVATSRERAGLVALNGDTIYDLGPLAELTEVKRKVKDRPADGIAWTEARQGQELMDRHAIQTLARSGATITFNDDNTLWLDENSLVVIKRPTTGARRARRASLTVLGGKVRGTVRPRGAGSLGVETSGGEAQIRSAGDDATEFSVTVNPDQSSTFSVLNGLAEIEKQGRKVQLSAQQALTLDSAGNLSAPVAIPDPPRPDFPADGHVHTTGPSTPPLEFRWRRAPRADGYRLMVARDPDFEDVVFDSTTSKTALRPANLGPGNYHWRAAAMAENAQGEFSAPQRVEIVGDTEAPPLTVELPAKVDQERLVVRGTAEPGSRVLVAGETVRQAADGSFLHELTLERGPNLIVIEAVDAAGNVAYHSQYVYAKF